jgi:calcineurin-like phosphoesterase family protein
MYEINKETYLIADTHFGHENISKYEPLRKAKASENGFAHIDELMVHNWNSVVSEEDTIFHLGDLAFKHKELLTLAQSLKGKKILLVGNHDKLSGVELLRENGWSIIDEVVIDISETKIEHLKQKIFTKIHSIEKGQWLVCCYVTDIEDKRVMFTHFPLFDDNPYDEKYRPITRVLEFIYETLACDLNIHGHTHSKGAKEHFCVSACVELTDFKPVRLANLLH